MKGKMRFAIVGLGHWGPRLIPKFLRHPKVDGMYCYDVDGARIARVKEEFPNIKESSDYRSILENGDIDAVIVATPVASHFDLAKQALEHGKHVLVEKPLTNSVTDAQTLVELASARNLQLMVDHIMVYSAAVRKIKELIKNDIIGEVLYIDAVRANLGMFQSDVNVIWDLAIHEFAIIDYLLGEMPEAIAANGVAHYGMPEEVAYITLFFGKGIIAHIHVSWLSPLKIRKLVLSARKKMLIFDDTSLDEKIRLFDRGVEISTSPDASKPEIVYHDGATQVVQSETAEPLMAMVDQFVKAIDEDVTPLTDGNAGLRMVRILEAAEKSLKEQGARIRLD
jgi:predicted dehydrogenase